MSERVQLLLMQHRSPALWDAGTVDSALAMAESVEDSGDGSSVAILVDGEALHVHGPATRFAWKPASEAPDLAARALGWAAEARAYVKEADRLHGARLRETRC